MAIGIGKEVVVQEYGPEHEGEMAGWVHCAEYPVSDMLQVAYARIEDGGARYTYVNHDGERLTHSNAVTGFFPSVELAFLLDGDSPRPIAHSKGQSVLAESPYRNINSGDDVFGDVFRSDELPEVGRGTWVLGEKAILGAIKAELKKRDKTEFYSRIYYALAALASPDLQLADAEMAENTALQVEYAEDYVLQLRNARLLDQEMVKNLTIFGEVQAEDIPEVFANSRRAVATIEQGLAHGLSKLVMSAAYLPIGWRPGGRTWRYMDPLEKDEDKSFGPELWSLQGKNIHRADDELRLEIAELHGRIDNAWQVREQLASLALKEAQLAGQE